MAIVENISSEIGDVIRIKTTIPIAGIVSLIGFSDITVGENWESNIEPDPPSGDPTPPERDESPFPLFDKGGKFSNYVNSIRVEGNFGYALSFANDGTREYRAIVSINLDSRIGDKDYPDAAYRLSGLIVSGGFAYSGYTTGAVGTTGATPGIARLDIALKTWTYYESPVLGGMSDMVDKFCNNKVYFFRSTSQGQAITSFDVITYTFLHVSYAPPSSLSTAPQSILGATISCALNKIYFQADIFEGSGEGNFIEYDIDTNIWTKLTPSVGDTYWEYSYNETDNLIYFYTRTLPGGSTQKAQMWTFDPVTGETRKDYPESPQTRMQQELYVINYRGISFSPDYFYIYNVPEEKWILAEPGQPDPPDPVQPQDRYFEKTFRYSIDAGMTFSNWMTLETISLQSLNISQKDQFVIDVAYKRVGNSTTDTLQWDSFLISGVFNDVEYPIYDSTIFKKYFPVNDPVVLGWALNVLEKLHAKGLLAEYVVRDSDTSDQDFVSYWYSITHLFALIVYLGRSFENIPSNKLVLIEFLKNFDIVLPFDENLTDLGYIYSNRTSEYELRGTSGILRREKDGDPINGEVIRLINLGDTDFFLWGLIEASKFGWCIGESSPMWTGTENMQNLVMAYEPTKNVEDLDNYPLLNAGDISIQTDAGIGYDTMYATGFAINTGVGYANADLPDQDFLVLINPQIDYEISFKIKKEIAADDDLYFGAYGYDLDFTRIDLPPIDGTGNGLNSFSYPHLTDNFPVNDEYYWFRGVLYSYDTSFDAALKLNFPNGRGLRLTSDMAYIGFYIYAGTSFAATSINIYDIKMRPLNLPISQGLLGVKNIIVAYLLNQGELNNGMNAAPGPDDSLYDEANDTLRTFIQTKLIPYNSFLIPKHLSNE